jgi:hypothetical protein
MLFVFNSSSMINPKECLKVSTLRYTLKYGWELVEFLSKELQEIQNSCRNWYIRKREPREFLRQKSGFVKVLKGTLWDCSHGWG